MEQIVDDLSIRAPSADFLLVTGVNVHGHGLDGLAAFWAEQFKEWMSCTLLTNSPHPPACVSKAKARFKLGHQPFDASLETLDGPNAIPFPSDQKPGNL